MVSSAAEMLKLVNEPLGVVDQKNALVAYIRAVSDNASLDEHAVPSIFIYVAKEDSLSLDESKTVSIVLIRTASDAMMMSDEVSKLTGYSRSFSDTAALGDSIERIVEYYRDLEASLGVTETIDADTVDAWTSEIADALGIESSAIARVYTFHIPGATLHHDTVKANRLVPAATRITQSHLAPGANSYPPRVIRLS